MHAFCLSGPGASFPLQHGGFVPREWLTANGQTKGKRTPSIPTGKGFVFRGDMATFHLGVLIKGLSLFFCLIDQGPPEGWRGPEDNFEDGPWHDDERGPYPPGDSPMRGRGKPRGGRRGRGVRR